MKTIGITVPEPSEYFNLIFLSNKLMINKIKLPSAPKLLNFQQCLLSWYAKCGRQFPWRVSRTPYQLLIAEIFLQQTDAKKVWSIYESFIKHFPTPESLANASHNTIEGLIYPLGLHYRANRLIDLATTLSDQFESKIPENFQDLIKLPGIGPYAATATMCFAYGKPYPIVDSNFARFYSRYFGFTLNGERPCRNKSLNDLASRLIPNKNFVDYNYSVLDFAALICSNKKPKCYCCPLNKSCLSPIAQSGKRKIGIDLFSGAGGLSYGAITAGLDIVYAFESDYPTASTYEYNFPSTAVVKEHLKEGSVISLCKSLGLFPKSIDVIIAGPPCQGFSISNLKTRNNENPKNHLWRIVLEFVAYLKPRGVIIENVCGLATYRNGEVANIIEKTLLNLGYNFKMYCLNAADFGVPQRRRRLFGVGIMNKSLPEDIIPANVSPVTVKMALSDLPLIPNGNCEDVHPYRLKEDSLSEYKKKMKKNIKDNEQVRNCLTTRSTDLIVRRFSTVPQGGNWGNIPKELFTTYSKPENCHRWLYRRLDEEQPSVTISNFRKNMLIHPWQDRTLSIREAARLQGFPDKFIFMGKMRSQQQQVANAVPPQMAEAVVEVVLKAIGLW